ncbi:hypothetical protein L810_4290 [Burkholderia sp. AU4i]|nr:hypothetical protein L810_4290 [Burkholderia sp. AU4i]
MQRALIARGIAAAAAHLQISNATFVVQPNTHQDIPAALARSRDCSRQHAVDQRH